MYTLISEKLKMEPNGSKKYAPLDNPFLWCRHLGGNARPVIHGHIKAARRNAAAEPIRHLLSRHGPVPGISGVDKVLTGPDSPAWHCAGSMTSASQRS